MGKLEGLGPRHVEYSCNCRAPLYMYIYIIKSICHHYLHHNTPEKPWLNLLDFNGFHVRAPTRGHFLRGCNHCSTWGNSNRQVLEISTIWSDLNGCQGCKGQFIGARPCADEIIQRLESELVIPKSIPALFQHQALADLLVVHHPGSPANPHPHWARNIPFPRTDW